MSEVALVSVVAQAMFSDPSTGQWAPFSAGYTQINVYYNSVALSYRLIGQNLDDGAYVINAMLVAGYTQLQPASDTFYSVIDGSSVYGFNFYSAEDARNFKDAFSAALSHVQQLSAVSIVHEPMGAGSNSALNSGAASNSGKMTRRTPADSEAAEQNAVAAPSTGLGALMGNVKLKKTSTGSDAPIDYDDKPLGESNAAPGSLTDALKGLTSVKLKKTGFPADGSQDPSKGATLPRQTSSPVKPAVASSDSNQPRPSIGGGGGGDLLGEMQMKLNKRKDVSSPQAPIAASSEPKLAAAPSASGLVDFKSQLKSGSRAQTPVKQEPPASESATPKGPFGGNQRPALKPKPADGPGSPSMGETAKPSKVDGSSIYDRFPNNSSDEPKSMQAGNIKIKGVAPAAPVSPFKALAKQPKPAADDGEDDWDETPAPAAKPIVEAKSSPAPIKAKAARQSAEFDWITDMQASIASLESPTAPQESNATSNNNSNNNNSYNSSGNNKPKVNQDDDWEDDNHADNSAPASKPMTPALQKKPAMDKMGFKGAKVESGSPVPVASPMGMRSEQSGSRGRLNEVVDAPAAPAEVKSTADNNSNKPQQVNSHNAVNDGGMMSRSGSSHNVGNKNNNLRAGSSNLATQPATTSSGDLPSQSTPPALKTSQSNLAMGGNTMQPPVATAMKQMGMGAAVVPAPTSTMTGASKSSLSPEMTALKQEIVAEMRQELQTVKREIIDVFMRELLKMAHALAADGDDA